MSARMSDYLYTHPYGERCTVGEKHQSLKRGLKYRCDGLRVRVNIIGHARIKYVGKYQSCMV